MVPKACARRSRAASSRGIEDGRCPTATWRISPWSPPRASMDSVLALVDLTARRRAAHPRVRSIDPSRSLASLRFDGAAGAAARRGRQRLGAGGAAARSRRGADGVRAARRRHSAPSRSRASTALSRYAFGRPIASFQAIKHRLADLYVEIELARSNAYYGAWALSNDSPELAAGRLRRARQRQRRLRAGEPGDDPAARRRRLHVGVRLPPLLSPRQVARRRARQRRSVARAAHPAAWSAQSRCPAGQMPVESAIGVVTQS